jgi:dihydropteroate synthase
MSWHTARGEIELDRCLVMGIVNRTPDSFYDGGRMGLDEATEHGLRLMEEGADILDVGAVKAGPGEPVTSHEEMERLLPLVANLTERGAVVSVETTRSEVAARALNAGAAIVNDVSGLADDAMAGVCSRRGAGLVLMHHGGQVRGRPRHPSYRDVVVEVRAALDRLAGVAVAAGVAREAIVLDPGLDFGKTTFHSLELMRRLDEIVGGDYPVLVAPSRKDVVGESLGLPPEDRLEGSLVLAALSAMKGAAVVRVHDVRAGARAVRMAEAVVGRSGPAAPVRGLWD